MSRMTSLAAATAFLAAPMACADMATPTGDAAAGEAAFRQCIACHVVVNDAGETLAGRNARTGPNLFGIAGRTAGTYEEFRYSASMTAAGEAGLVWDEEGFVTYVQDPTGFLREYLDDSGARGSMSFRVRSPEDAANLYAYIMSLGPEAAE
ncbi:c-type cytochrome [Rhodophyticola sp. CCM32]|uniref:c-type cytochrome n=1 Tax=Rhodophyticola sp. CCM32 TaxID=2916397 RepID=UPI00107F0314|nr:c-type cytochrome [Rhodophyticola sp. CCM32]QBY02076.1 c-type cytochrome [Rhodophyticola sp. CCM32]